MNKEAFRYRHALIKHLHCISSTRRILIKQFDASLSSFLEEHPSPSYHQLVSAFGPPENMATVIMEAVPSTEQTQYQNHRHFIQIISIILTVLIIFFSAYTYFCKTYEPIVVYEELIPGNPFETQEGG